METKQKHQITEQQISIDIGEDITINGDLCLVKDSTSIVLFAHGSGSGRFSPRNRYVAQVLQQAKISTLLIDLLTQDEESVDEITRQYRFDIPLLKHRVTQTTKWLMDNPQTKDMAIGYFGASTGAAAALMAAAELGDKIAVIVSRGGRPDLAGDALALVKSPTLLIVGGNDPDVIDINTEAAKQISAEKELIIIPGATHLFQEPGMLEKVAKKACDFFDKHLRQ